DTESRDVRCVDIYDMGDSANALERAFNAAGLVVTQVARDNQVADKLKGCQLLIEATQGNEQQKKVALQLLDEIAGDDTILATTSAQNLNKFKELVRVPSDRKSTRLNSSHVSISYAVFCLTSTINNI